MSPCLARLETPGSPGVDGEAAAPLFRELAALSSAPRWNFYKYVVGR